MAKTTTTTTEAKGRGAKGRGNKQEVQIEKDSTDHRLDNKSQGEELDFASIREEARVNAEADRSRAS